MQRDRFKVAMARYLRRCQLWRAARAACPSYASFRTSTGAIEGAVSRLLADEFGP